MSIQKSISRNDADKYIKQVERVDTEVIIESPTQTRKSRTISNFVYDSKESVNKTIADDPVETQILISDKQITLHNTNYKRLAKT